MADVSVRPARATDTAEVARIQLESWRTGYARLLPAALLDTVTPDQVEARWAAAVAAPPTPRHHLLVACEQDRVVGFVAFGPAEPSDTEGAFAAEDAPPAPDAVGAVLTLLVEPRWGRRGHGSRLLAAAVDHLTAEGMDHVIAWVPEADAPSTSLYTSAGWEPDGYVRALDADGREFREVRLHARLDQPAGPRQP